MSKDIDIAKERLLTSDYTCVLCKGDIVYTSTLKGIAPVLGWLDEGKDMEGFAAADRIVGKAAGMLFVLAKVKEVYAPIMSESAVELLRKHGITCSCEETVKKIINRMGTDICPMEKTVQDIDDPKIALETLKQTVKRLRAQSSAQQ